jgi:hypothetical protein
VLSNSGPLQLTPAQRACVVARHEPVGDAGPVELVAAERHDAAPVAVLKLTGPGKSGSPPPPPPIVLRLENT